MALLFIIPSLAISTARGLSFLWTQIACGREHAGSYLKKATSRLTNSRSASLATSSRPLRLLLAGLGAFGKEHLSRLTERSDVKVVGVADSNPAALEPIRVKLGVAECLTDPLRMIDAVEADAIIVATPAVSHVEIGVRALSRNLPVLLEKPVAPSAGSAVPLLAAARSSAGFVAPGHVLRFSRDHVRMVETVRSGRIGEVLYVSSRRYRDDGHAVRYPDDDPVLMTLVHDIDIAQWVTGSDFHSIVARRSEGVGYRSMTAVSTTTATGVICELRTAWTFTDGELPPDRVEVVGNRGSVELTVGAGLEIYAEGQHTHYPAASEDDPLRSEQDHFLACVRDRSVTPALTLSQALIGLTLADAAIESLRRGSPIAKRETGIFNHDFG
jgi:predicted dehydrogenase